MGKSERRLGSLQFSLRAVLLLMTVSALACSLLFAAPIQVTVTSIIFLVTLMPVAFVTTLTYGQGYARTFAIGAIFPGTIVFLYSYLLAFGILAGDLSDDSILMRLSIMAYSAGAVLVMLAYGGVAMLVRWLVEPAPEAEQSPAADGLEQESPLDVETQKGTPKRRKGCLQFSLRTHVLVMTVTALFCGLFFAAPVAVASVLLYFHYTALPVVVTVMLIYGRGYLRTFAIGAAFPGLPLPLYTYFLLESVSVGHAIFESRLVLALCFCVPLVMLGLYGTIALAVRWLIDRRQCPTPQRPLDTPSSESPFDREVGTE